MAFLTDLGNVIADIKIQHNITNVFVDLNYFLCIEKYDGMLISKDGKLLSCNNNIYTKTHVLPKTPKVTDEMVINALMELLKYVKEMSSNYCLVVVTLGGGDIQYQPFTTEIIFTYKVNVVTLPNVHQ